MARAIGLRPFYMQLHVTKFHQAEQVRNLWVAEIEPQVTREMLSEPKFWANIAYKLSPWDHIEVRAEDGTWWAEYIVLGCDRAWAKVHELRHVSLSTADVAATQAQMEEFDVSYAGGKWRVMRKADKQVLRDGFRRKEEAEGWLIDHKKATA